MNYETTEELLKDVKMVKETYKEFGERIILHLKELNGEYVGVLYGWIMDNIYTIDTILVNKEYRNVGIATELLNKAINEAIEKRCNHIFIYLEPFNHKYLLEKTLLSKDFFELGYLDNYKCFMLKIN